MGMLPGRSPDTKLGKTPRTWEDQVQADTRLRPQEPFLALLLWLCTEGSILERYMPTRNQRTTQLKQLLKVTWMEVAGLGLGLQTHCWS